MKTKELRALSVDDLVKKEQDVREDLFKLRFQHSIRRLENPAKLAVLKKDIARIQTVLTEKKNQ
ncbi:50S ribosomal protein L29 [uncultured Desulfobulbus sp.]|jgi:large subunit ribosomal protein L29|uniref:50S ribosomal protein L29 n=1 Tax=uncultured Desulfobulbus sp. TaxID=239745 RepID=UPI0026396559|nr:50S ribosomal protein L29 [uncultured Desulfobulbus sp.]